MLERKLETVKKNVDEHLKKKFIRLYLFLKSSSVLLIKKFEKSFRFCVDYRKFNALIVKN